MSKCVEHDHQRSMPKGFQGQAKMSYHRDLDEIPEIELQQEMLRRATRRESGLCDYCQRTADDPACKFPERHRLAFSRRGVKQPVKAVPIYEIVGPDGKVHYRRPLDHPDIYQAWRTPGYTVRPMTPGFITREPQLIDYFLE